MPLLRTCVTPSGRFRYGIHRPHFRVDNFRENNLISSLGSFEDGSTWENKRNFPENAVTERSADTIYEIPNPFPFRGTTYIAHPWAKFKSEHPEHITLPRQEPCSLTRTLEAFFKDGTNGNVQDLIKKLPDPLLLALAANSTDPDDLILLARLSCEFEYSAGDGYPTGLVYERGQNEHPRAAIKKPLLFETVANNIHLPDPYKVVMVLRPGAQGGSEILGEWQNNESHIFEYLRRNSYIPWGHYAANMADDAVRYRVSRLSLSDMRGLRHLYYQRTFSRLAQITEIPIPESRRTITEDQLEELRIRILDKISRGNVPAFSTTLWGWNYGFDYAPSKYRLHASHQQIHQQFAMLPEEVEAFLAYETPDPNRSTIPSYGCGDLVTRFIREYRQETGQHFFDDYIRAIRSNRRMDRQKGEKHSLLVFEDDHVMAFVPKAQTSQWEIQMMPKGPVGNILEADIKTRRSLDLAMLTVMKVLDAMGARMVTVIEFQKRFHERDEKQHLLYSFLPKLPESPGAFSEAQLRWINGHFPEDFAAACRDHLPQELL